MIRGRTGVDPSGWSVQGMAWLELVSLLGLHACQGAELLTLFACETHQQPSGLAGKGMIREASSQAKTCPPALELWGEIGMTQRTPVSGGKLSALNEVGWNEMFHFLTVDSFLCIIHRNLSNFSRSISLVSLFPSSGGRNCSKFIITCKALTHYVFLKLRRASKLAPNSGILGVLVNYQIIPYRHRAQRGRPEPSLREVESASHKSRTIHHSTHEVPRGVKLPETEGWWPGG